MPRGPSAPAAAPRPGARPEASARDGAACRALEEARDLRQAGNAAFTEGRLTAAAASYRAALAAIAAADGPARDELSVLCSSNLAACALRAGDVAEALRCCDAALVLDPGHRKARYRRALALLRRAPGGDAAARAAELLEAQRDLERAGAVDAAICAAEAELLSAARAEGVRLRPPPQQLPRGWRDFGYAHAPEPPPVGAQDGGPGRERNLLIFLHGFGGRKGPFMELAEKLGLPKTAVLAFDGPEAVPEELLDDPPAFGWFTIFDEEFQLIEPCPGEQRRLASLRVAARGLADVVASLASLGWAPEEIFLFGYGQGGTVALDLLLGVEHGCPHDLQLGGVVGVATEVLPERLLEPPGRGGAAVKAPVLLIHGAADQRTPPRAAEASAARLRADAAQLQLHVFPGRSGEMLRGGHAEEMRCLMEFLTDHLHGVGRRGSEEALRRLGATPVEELERVDAAPVEDERRSPRPAGGAAQEDAEGGAPPEPAAVVPSALSSLD